MSRGIVAVWEGRGLDGVAGGWELLTDVYFID